MNVVEEELARQKKREARRFRPRADGTTKPSTAMSDFMGRGEHDDSGFPGHHPPDHTVTSHTGGTAWRLFYSDSGGDQQEIGLGTDGQVLTSTGAASAPAMEDAAGGTGDVAAVDVWHLPGVMLGA